VPRDQALRRIANARLIAVQLEAALAAGNRARVPGLAKDWRTAQTAMGAALLERADPAAIEPLPAT
jgi:hypothetical protein